MAGAAALYAISNFVIGVAVAIPTLSVDTARWMFELAPLIQLPWSEFKFVSADPFPLKLVAVIVPLLPSVIPEPTVTSLLVLSTVRGPTTRLPES
jgi:hypothetical protein